MIAVEQRSGIVDRARTLSERLAIARERLASDADAIADESGVKYLELWSRAFAPGDRDAFTRRLAWDDISLEQAALALSDALAPVDAREAWLDDAERFTEDLGAATIIDAELPFAEIWSAWSAAAYRALTRRRASAEKELGPTAAAAVQRQLARELSRTGALAVLEAFRHHGRYKEFISATMQDRCAAIAATYPMWFRQLTILVEGWIDSTIELLTRLSADRQLIQQTFGRNAAKLVDIEPGLSDPHHGRRRVAKLTFASGLTLVYKPRPVNGERALNELIAWLASRGIEPSLPTVRVLDRGEYGWMDNVRTEEFNDRNAVEKYYRRAGGLLCLMHALRGRDLHWENVIATGEGPVIIDAELLLQPIGDDEPASSPLTTGLLSCLQPGADGEIVDVGGFRGDRIAHGPTAERVWKNIGTDAIDVADEFPSIGPRGNRVILDGVVQDPGDFAAEFLGGFTDMYRGLVANRDGLLAGGGPIDSLGAVRARVLIRPSHHYGAALHALADARFQRDGRQWGCALETLNRRYKFSVSMPRTWPFASAERHALEKLDLPTFWNPAHSTDVLDGEHVVAPAFFREPGLKAVNALIRELSEEDLANHLAVLGRVLGQSTRSRFSTPLEIPAGSQDPRAALIATAEWIGREIAARAEQSNGTLATLRLYDGAAGPALLFAALASVTGNARWRELAKSSAAELAKFEWPNGDAVPTGATTGIGSLIYALTLSSKLTFDFDALDAAADLASRLTPDVIVADESCDVSSGIAGAILALLALNASRKDDVLLATATVCAQLLRNRLVLAGQGAAWAAPGEQPRPGFAHGAAGIALALSRLYETTQDESVLPMINAAHAFERGLFSVADRNWPSAGAHGDAGAVLMNAWCNGAPGIGLARVFVGKAIEDPTIAGEVGIAIEAAARAGTIQADHLCCGNMGRADILFTIGQVLPSRQPMQIAMQIAGTVVSRARERGHFRLSTAGAEYEVFTPGFFNGLSGIAYQLLRFAEPRKLPSVLAFGS